MIRNYLKIAVRTLYKHKGYSIINVAGLALGMACVILIFLFIQDEISFDKHHLNSERIYRVASKLTSEGKLFEEASSLAIPVSPALQTDFPEITFTRLFKLFQQEPLITYDDRKFREKNFFFADSTVFDVLTFPLIKGNPDNALVNPFSVVLTEETADKYFGDENPMGKILRFENNVDFTVTGVMENIPSNSHIAFDFLGSFNGLRQVFPLSGTPEFWYQSWYWNPCWTYAMLPEAYPPDKLEQALPAFVDKYFPEQLKNSMNMNLYLQPIQDIHLHSHLYNEIKANSDESYVYIFSVIGLFILVIACINFMNLASARSARRAKEIGLRKVVGAFRFDLIRQFLGESFVLTFIALIVSLILVEMMLPVMNVLSGKSLELDFGDNIYLIIGLVILTIFTGLLSGSYPAMFLSSFKPVKVLKGTFSQGAKNSRFRKILIVFQFAISIVLISATSILYNQLEFLRNKKLGFDKEQILMVPIRGTEIKAQYYRTFKNELLQHSNIKYVTATSDIIGQKVEVKPFVAEGMADGELLHWSGLLADQDFVETYGVEIVQGRDLSYDFPTDDSSAFMINETAVRALGWDEPIGKKFAFNVPGEVVGVVRDFNYAPLHQEIKPLVIKILPTWFDILSVKINPADIGGTLAYIEETWNKYSLDKPFEFSFLDSEFGKIYRAEERLRTIFVYCSLLAIFIACLGLFGLATFTAEQRTKEIGIRKVLGASISNILLVMSKETVILVLLANVVAIPVAYYVMNKWLQNFAYRIEIGIGVFVISALLALLIALLTVTVQSLKAASADPVKSLRYE